MSILEHYKGQVERFISFVKDKVPDQTEVTYEVYIDELPENFDLSFVTLATKTKYFVIRVCEPRILIIYMHDNITFHEYFKETPREIYNILYNNICFSRWVKVKGMYQTLCFNVNHNDLFKMYLSELNRLTGISVEVVPNGMYFRINLCDMKVIQEYLPLVVSDEYD